jgi:hypothetical protein
LGDLIHHTHGLKQHFLNFHRFHSFTMICAISIYHMYFSSSFPFIELTWPKWCMSMMSQVWYTSYIFHTHKSKFLTIKIFQVFIHVPFKIILYGTVGNNSFQTSKCWRLPKLSRLGPIS